WGGARTRPCHRAVQGRRSLGCGREVELRGLPVPRADPPHVARACAELLRGVLQLARRSHAPHVLAASGSVEIRRSRVDDREERCVVHPRVSPHDRAHSPSPAIDGEAAPPRGPAIARGWARGTSLEVEVRCRHRSATRAYRTSPRDVSHAVGRARNTLLCVALVCALIPLTETRAATCMSSV